MPGTTRDSIDTELHYNEQRFVLIDTAGLRRAARVKDNIEFYTTLRSIRSLQRADIAMVLVEAPGGNHRSGYQDHRTGQEEAQRDSHRCQQMGSGREGHAHDRSIHDYLS